MTVSEEIQEFVKWVEQGCKPVIKKVNQRKDKTK